MSQNRACPLCGSITTLPICPNHGRNVTIYTLTSDQLWRRLHGSEAGANGVRDALAALIQAEAGTKRAVRVVGVYP